MDRLVGWVFLLVGTAAAGQRVPDVREADAVCAKCHAEIFQRYVRTPMANASGRAVDGLEVGSFRHSASGVEYRVFGAQGAAWIGFERLGDGALKGQQELEYFMGSGNHGRTYLYSVNGYWFETPIAYYARKRGYDMRPAYLEDKEMPFNLPMNSSCLRCHVSGTQIEDAGTRNHYKGLPFLNGGITCESCHGDGAKHVASGGKSAIVNPAKLDADRRDSVCISCHLEGDAAVERRGRKAVDYRPGERIADYVAYFVQSARGTTSRAVSQVEALNVSLCKRVTGDRMSCVSCHDPHGGPSASERTAFYRSKCLACHTQAKYVTTHYSENPDCIACHMPKGAPNDIPHEQWTDHRILRRGDTEMKAASPGQPALIPVPGVTQDSSERDVALGYYDLVVNGDSSEGARASGLLEEASAAVPADVEVLKALGVLAQIRNDRERASEMYQKVLTYSPEDYNAGLNLGVLLARSGKLNEAAKLWQGVFDRNEDITELGMNLAAARCMLHEKSAAEAVLRRVLLYNPDHGRAREELRSMEAGEEACER
jgi:predicted CXXCH cytochrome family protein